MSWQPVSSAVSGFKEKSQRPAYSEVENEARDSIRFCSLTVPTRSVNLLRVHLSFFWLVYKSSSSRKDYNEDEFGNVWMRNV